VVEPVVARSVEEALALREGWAALPTESPHADLDFYLAVIDERDEVLGPHAVLLLEDGVPAALAAMRLEEIRLVATFGYREVLRPRVRALTLVPGGIVAPSPSAERELARCLLRSLAGREAEVILLPSLRCDSELHRTLRGEVGALRRSHFAETRTHRRLHLPATFDEFLASRTKKVRSGIRYDTKRLDQRLGDRLRLERLDAPADFDRIFRDIVRVAELTYQRGLGAGFADTPERRRLTRLALERGWFRAWVLYDEQTPIAFWQGNVYGCVYHSGTTGYDPAYRKDRVGIYLLMRVIEDLCSVPEVDIFDFGFGDADYKRHFSDEAWDESDVVVFAPTLRPLWINATRTAVMGSAQGVRRGLERLGVADRVKTAWRRRLGASD
jgi:CelD/BcsL family acetyltransferase involved in cellulose biosynthesis